MWDDGFRTNIIEDKNTGYSRVTEYTAKGVTVTTTKIDEYTNKPTQSIIETDRTSGKITGTVFDTETGNPSMTYTKDPKSGLTQRDFYDPETKAPTKKEVMDPVSKTKLVTTFVPGSTTRATVELYDDQSNKLKMQIKYEADGVTPAETINYGDDGKPLPK
ncbi:MAG TPA: hypothetical protein VFG90_04505 [Nitrososphaeraceae archaeon]|nr:hypothetical protein [Nitrososphaeraceae archaeon]